MITARVDTSKADFFVRDRVRVVASVSNGRDLVILGRDADGNEFQYRPGAGPGAEPDLAPPEGVSLYALDARTDVARAVYLALKEHFEPQDAVPTAADQAYHDARADLQRAHALIDKLIDVVARPPVAISGTVLETRST